MTYLYFKLRLVYWTFISKLSANAAEHFKKIYLFVFLLDYALNKRSIALSDEAIFCMKQIDKWQKKAKLCVLAHHENEKVLKLKESK